MIKKYQSQGGAKKFIDWFVARKPETSTIEVAQSVVDDELVEMFDLSQSATFPDGQWNGYIIKVVPDFKEK